MAEMTEIRGIDLRTEPDFVERYERILAGDTAWGPEKREQYLQRNYQKYKEVKRNSEMWKGGEKYMLDKVESITVETEDGKKIATIINDDEIDEAIIVAAGYTVRIKPKAD